MIKNLEQFRSEADAMQASLDAPVLDGTPNILVMDDGKNTLVYGELYPDQIKPGSTDKIAFRYQRRFDLCGCFCFEPARAEELAARINATLAPGQKVRVMHRRDWILGELTKLKQSILLLETALGNLQ